MRALLFLIVVLLLMVAAFALQNPGIITVHFLHLSAATSLLAVIVAAFGVGLLVGFLAGIPASRRRNRRIRDLEAEASSLRKPADPSPPVVP